MRGHMNNIQQDKLLRLHSNTEDFTASTWIIVIDKYKDSYINNEDIDWSDEKIFTKLESFLEKDHCKLLNSTVGDIQIIFKVYCNENQHVNKVTNRKREDDPKDILKNTLNDFLYKMFNEKSIQLENNDIRRSHFYYGSYDILDYAMKLDAGTLNNYNLGEEEEEEGNSIKDIKMPRAEVYDMIRKNDFIESPATWGLDRIDQHVGLLDNEYKYKNKASDIDVYVIDTGIRITHNEFEGRATFLINTVGDNINTDCAGHGTFVASEIGGKTYGVAKSVRLFAVKTLGCDGDGDFYTILSGITQVIQSSQTNTSRRSVVNLSLGGGKSTLLDNAVASLAANNIIVTVSAGNVGRDACQYSPANLGGTPSAHIITVGASDRNDDRPSWGNTGSCVTISAPGVDITGAWFTSDSSSTQLSGTSMSSPLVAGTAALVLEQDITLTVEEVKNTILTWKTPGIVSFTTPNGGGKNLLFSLIDINSLPPPTIQPTPTPTPNFVPGPFDTPSTNFESKSTHLQINISFTLLLLYVLHLLL